MKFDLSSIEQVDITHFDELLDVLYKANDYAKERSGIPLWLDIPYAINKWKSHFDEGQCFVLRDEHKLIVATITITFEDPIWSDDSDAIYMHKLMKDPQSNVANIGLLFIYFAAQLAVSKKITHLRFDTKNNQFGLIAYYKRLGFQEKGTFTYEDTDKQGIRFQAKAIDVRDQLLAI